MDNCKYEAKHLVYSKTQRYQVVSPNGHFARRRFARTQSRFARTNKILVNHVCSVLHLTQTYPNKRLIKLSQQNTLILINLDFISPGESTLGPGESTFSSKKSTLRLIRRNIFGRMGHRAKTGETTAIQRRDSTQKYNLSDYLLDFFSVTANLICRWKKRSKHFSFKVFIPNNVYY